MTEYDYSPDAVERYYAKQSSVARWVDRQAYEARGYGNPFVPEPSQSGGSGSGGSSSTANKPLSRSVSTPVDARHTRPPTHRSHREHREGHRMQSSNASSPTLVPTVHRYSTGTGTGTSSQTHSRSHSQGQTHRRPPPSRSQTYAHTKGSSSTTHLPARSTTLPTHLQTQNMAQYTSAPGQPVVMQNGGQTYVVVPPHGTRVQVCSAQSQSVSPTYAAPAPTYPQGYAHAYPAGYAQPVSPTSTSKKQPLLKRIFGSHSGSNANSSSNAYGATSRRGGGNVPVLSTAGARRRTTSMHY